MELTEKKPTEEQTESTPNHKITPEEFLERRRNTSVVYVFDVRDQDAFDEGHLAGAYCLPLEFVENNLHRLPFSGDMLLYDGGEGVVHQVGALLTENAFTDFYYIEEGYDSLQKALSADPKEVKFDELDKTEQAHAIEQALDDKVRDFLARDGGGLEVVAIEGSKVIVAYQGACGGCPSSTAGTLNFIQSTLTLALNHPIEVVPTDSL